MSITGQRKERQKAEREKMILDVSRRLLLEQGFSGLTMDRLVKEVEYSKGVVYEHFKSKEDLVLALAVESMERRAAWFSRAVTFQGRHRERIMAIGVGEELFVRLNSQYFHTEQIIRLSLLSERASDERYDALLRKEGNCFKSVLSIVNDAVEAGDFKLPPTLIPADIVFSLWSHNFGAYSIMHSARDVLAAVGVTQVFANVRLSCNAMLDGMGWRPLTTEWDFEASYRRILREVFPQESLLAGLS
jgi:AcrR family transcriptional regulator